MEEPARWGDVGVRVPEWGSVVSEEVEWGMSDGMKCVEVEIMRLGR